jgi:hypothetical protein
MRLPTWAIVSMMITVPLGTAFGWYLGISVIAPRLSERGLWLAVAALAVTVAALLGVAVRLLSK